MKEDAWDDFEPNQVYNVGHSSEDESVFEYFNPKKKGGSTGLKTSGIKTKKSIYTRKSMVTNKNSWNKNSSPSNTKGEYYTEGDQPKIKKGKS